ncbi:MAG: DUF937 domain-containing protein [Rhizobiaceae bacterium]|nr:DUF937 domain-containing protein [Rhizobiaceae bacterium]
MLPLFDMMMKAQGGNAMEAMAKQFGLAQDQMQQAMAALMPAFSTGLKRSVTNPYDFSSLMSAAASGNYGQYFEDLTKAFSPQGVADGNNVLALIFGSKDVSRAVAAQAEQMSGIGQEIFKKMMPVVANTMMGGVFRQMASQLQAAGEAISRGQPADFFGQWMEAAGLKEKPKAANPFLDNPFAQGFQSLLSQAGAANPFFAMFTAGGEAKPDGETDKPQAAAAQDAFSGMLGQMFDSGIEVQKAYQKSVESIFDGYLASMQQGRK